MSYLKKTLAIFLLVCMLASMMPVGTAFAAEETPAAATANAADGAGGADPNTCDHLKDVDGAKISAFKDSKCELCGYTCTSHTWNEGGVCVTCGTECEHVWNELNDGTTYRQCSKCSTICNHMGFFDHDWLCQMCGYQQCAHASTEIAAEVKATCTTPGKTEGEKCKDCGATIKAQTDVPALGHDWSKKDGVCARGCGVTCTHTKTAEGGGTVSTIKDGVCEVCGLAGAVCTHDWTAGLEQSTCSKCGAVCTHENADGTTKFDAKTGACSECGFQCEHKSADGTTKFDPKTGACSVCGFQCEHKDADGKTAYACDAATGEYICGLCKKTCAHSEWDTTNVNLAKCKECGKECDHEKDGSFNFDPATGKCLNGCPFTCPHAEVRDNICTICKMSMLVKVTEADGKATVDPDSVHAGRQNVVVTTQTDTVIPKKALKECASSSGTSVTIETDKAIVSLDAAALQAIDTAVTDENGSATVHIAEVAGASEKTYEVCIKDQTGAKIASDGKTLGSGKATVTLKNVMTEPKEVRHLKDDGKTLIEKLTPTYDGTNHTVTVTLTHFSQIVLSAHVTPTIDPNSLKVPAAKLANAYGPVQLVATGDPEITWSVAPDTLPKGLALSEKGVLSGTVDTTVTPGEFKAMVTAANAYGSDTKELTITVEDYIAATVYSVGAGDTLVEVESYPTLQQALTNAQDGQVVMLMDDFPNENVSIDKDIVISGNDPAAPRKLKSITIQPGAEGGALFIQADTVTVKKGAFALLGDGNNIRNVANENTVGNVDNLNPNVIIDGGHYGALSPAASGSYVAIKGDTGIPTFDTEIPMEYCRDFAADADGNLIVDKNGNPKVIQRYARYNSSTKRYELADFKFDITKVSNSGYHMPGSQKTLVFSTNLDYKLADRDRGASAITVTSGNSSKPISSVYYDITADQNGKAQITLKASTLNKLALGRYTLKYDGPVGTDSMYFHISDTVRTGDTSNIGLWMGIMGVSVVALCAVAGVLVVKSKKKKGGAKGTDVK